MPVGVFPASTGVFHDSAPSLMAVTTDSGIPISNPCLQGHPEPFKRSIRPLAYARLTRVDLKTTSLLFSSGLILSPLSKKFFPTKAADAVDDIFNKLLSAIPGVQIIPLSMIIFVEMLDEEFEAISTEIRRRHPNSIVVRSNIAIRDSQLELELIASLRPLL